MMISCKSVVAMTLQLLRKSVFSITRKIDNIGIRTFLTRKQKISEITWHLRRIELWTFAIPVWCSPFWANLACASYGTFKLPSIHAPLDSWTDFIKVSDLRANASKFRKESVRLEWQRSPSSIFTRDNILLLEIFVFTWSNVWCQYYQFCLICENPE